MDAKLERQAAAALLDEGIRAPVRAPLLFRVFGKQQFQITIRPPSQGTLHRMGRIALSHRISEHVLAQLDETNVHLLYLRYGWPLSMIVANGWLNSYILGNRFFTVVVAWYLRWHMDNLKLLTAASVLDLLSNKRAFTNTIRLVGGMSMTAPNLSQVHQGS